jgi:hypothetical protein
MMSPGEYLIEHVSKIAYSQKIAIANIFSLQRIVTYMKMVFFLSYENCNNLNVKKT